MKTLATVAYTHYASDPRVQREARALARAGYEVDVFALEGTLARDPMIPDRIAIHGIPLSRYRGNSPGSYMRSYLGFLFRAGRALEAFHRKRRYAVVHVHTMPDILVFAALGPKLRGARVLLDLHDHMPEIYAEKFGVGLGDWRVRLVSLAERASARFADAVLVPSEPQADRLRAIRVPEHKLTLVHNFPDPGVFGSLGQEIGREDPSIFRLVYHGTLAPRLGVDVAFRGLAAARTSLDAMGPWRMEVIGDGDARSDLLALSQTLGLGDRVFFSNGSVPLDQLLKRLKGVSLGLVPSRRQLDTDLMLPTKLLEYVHLGVPALATPTRTVRHYFHSGQVLFVEPETPEAWAIAVLEARRDAEGRRARAERALSFFAERSWAREAERLVARVESLSGA